jgi:hypothetical protein
MSTPGEMVYDPNMPRPRCAFRLAENDAPCRNTATNVVPGFWPPYMVCKDHHHLLDTLIDLAT